MPSFVATIVDAMASSTQAFLVAVVNSYWAMILGIGLITYVGYRLLNMARLK